MWNEPKQIQFSADPDLNSLLSFGSESNDMFFHCDNSLLFKAEDDPFNSSDIESEINALFKENRENINISINQKENQFKNIISKKRVPLDNLSFSSPPSNRNGSSSIYSTGMKRLNGLNTLNEIEKELLNPIQNHAKNIYFSTVSSETNKNNVLNSTAYLNTPITPLSKISQAGKLFVHKKSVKSPQQFVLPGNYSFSSPIRYGTSPSMLESNMATAPKVCFSTIPNSASSILSRKRLFENLNPRAKIENNSILLPDDFRIETIPEENEDDEYNDEEENREKQIYQNFLYLLTHKSDTKDIDRFEEEDEPFQEKESIDDENISDNPTASKRMKIEKLTHIPQYEILEIFEDALKRVKDGEKKESAVHDFKRNTLSSEQLLEIEEQFKIVWMHVPNIQLFALTMNSVEMNSINYLAASLVHELKLIKGSTDSFKGLISKLNEHKEMDRNNIPKTEIVNIKNPVQRDLKIKSKTLPDDSIKFLTQFNNFFNENYSVDLNIDTSARLKYYPCEDSLLLVGLKRCGTEWDPIHLNYLPSKSSKQISIRYKNMTSRRSPNNPIKDFYFQMLQPLSEEEERLLYLGVSRFGKNYAEISRVYLPNRAAPVLKRLWCEISSNV